MYNTSSSPQPQFNWCVPYGWRNGIPCHSLSQEKAMCAWLSCRLTHSGHGEILLTRRLNYTLCDNCGLGGNQNGGASLSLTCQGKQVLKEELAGMFGVKICRLDGFRAGQILVFAGKLCSCETSCCSLDLLQISHSCTTQIASTLKKDTYDPS